MQLNSDLSSPYWRNK